VLSGVSREGKKRTTETCLSAKQIQVQRPEMKQDDDRIGMNRKGQWRFSSTPASMKSQRCRGISGNKSHRRCVHCPSHSSLSLKHTRKTRREQSLRDWQQKLGSVSDSAWHTVQRKMGTEENWREKTIGLHGTQFSGKGGRN